MSGHKASEAEELAPLEPRPKALEEGWESAVEPLARRGVPAAGSSRLLWVPAALFVAAATSGAGAAVLLSGRAEGPTATLAAPSEPEVISEEVEQPPTLMPPLPAPLPSQVMLRSLHGQFVAAERDGVLVANRPWADDWEKFAVVGLGDGVVALKSFHGSFVRVDEVTGGLAATAPSQDSPGAMFQVTFAEDSGLQLQSSTGKYVSVDAAGALRAYANEPSQGAEFEVFAVSEPWPAHVAIKSVFGKYLRSEASGVVAADGRWPLDDWKRLRVTPHADGRLSLQFDHGEYLSVRAGGSLHSSNELASSERFVVTHLDDGTFTMQDHEGRYVWAGNDGALRLESDGSWEASKKLEVVFLP